jgi:hypothetical protein
VKCDKLFSMSLKNLLFDKIKRQAYLPFYYLCSLTFSFPAGNSDENREILKKKKIEITLC